MQRNYSSNIKATLRHDFKELRSKVLPLVEKKIILQVYNKCNRLIKKIDDLGYVGIYWPLNGEVDLRILKTISNLKIALPATTKDGKINYHHWGTNILDRDFCKIPAPLSEPVLEPEEITLLLIPAISIDLKGNRLGYGGGYFDRLRSQSKWRKVKALGIIPQACISESVLPYDSWDIPLDGWISEKGEQIK